MTHQRYCTAELKSIARSIADMHYEDMSYLIGTLADMLSTDADKDRAKNRIKLATACESASVYLSNASMDLERAMEISAPYMKE